MDLCREKHVKSNFCLTFDHYFVLNFCSVVVHCKVIVQFVSHHHCNFFLPEKGDLLIIAQSLALYNNAQLNPAISNSQEK